MGRAVPASYKTNPAMHDANGRLRKLIIFSEHRDTLNHLPRSLAGVLGNADSIVTIHGGTHRDERRRIQAIFQTDPHKAYWSPRMLPVKASIFRTQISW